MAGNEKATYFAIYIPHRPATIVGVSAHKNNIAKRYFFSVCLCKLVRLYVRSPTMPSDTTRPKIAGAFSTKRGIIASKIFFSNLASLKYQAEFVLLPHFDRADGMNHIQNITVGIMCDTHSRTMLFFLFLDGSNNVPNCMRGISTAVK